MLTYYRSMALILILALLLPTLAACRQEGETPDICILYTNDVHCGIDDYIGYAGLAAYKHEMEAVYDYVTLVDCGDAVQGDFIGAVSSGEYIVDIMNELDYALAVPGNHEFDYGMEQLAALIDRVEAEYLACNAIYSGSSQSALEDTEPYKIIDYGDIEIAFIGVVTPENIAKSTPSYFMENGEYVYDFLQGEDGQALYDCVQGYVDECLSQGADYVVALSHLGDAAESSPYTSVELIEATTGIDVVLDGHAHSVIPSRTVEDQNGEDVLLSSTGTKLEQIGKLVITGEGEITTELISDYTETDSETEQFINGILAQHEEALSTAIATSDIALSCSSETGARLVRNRETAIGNMIADAYRTIGDADISFINGGGIRADLPIGTITYADLLAVHPFGNTLCVVKATGAEILDFLEVACMYTQAQAEADGNAVGENGGFQQVSGLKFTVDTSIPSPVITDENGNMIRIDGERRITDVYVQGDDGEYVPLDPSAVYTVASQNYLLKEGGSGYAEFTDNEFIIDEGVADYQVLITYITEILNGQLGERYSATEGRITVK